MKTAYKIAVIGAGPAGCTLANLLRKANIDVVIFESETSLDARSQGGSLDLHTDSGLFALKECGLFAEFEKYARYDGEAMALADKRNKRILAWGGTTSSKDSRGRPEIDRVRLREILAKPLSEDGIIRWNHHLKSVNADGTLNFTTSTASGFDLIVGADGAWSKIRKLLTDVTPFYAGIGGFEARIPNAAEDRPWIHKLTNKGSWISLSDGLSVACQQQGDGSITATFWKTCSEDFAQDYDLTDPTAVKEALHREYRDWAAEHHAVIDAVDYTSFEPRTLHRLPTGMTWDSKPGFSLIGDAAHLMSPFAGEGVNCAMLDACKLANAITKAAAEGAEGQDGLAPYVARFEEEMCKRTAPIQRSAQLNLEYFYYHPGAPCDNIEGFVVRNVVEEIGWWARVPATVAAYTYFFFVKWRLG